MSESTTDQPENVEKSQGDDDAVQKDVKIIQHSIVEAVRSANLLAKRSEGYELFVSFPLYAQFMNEQQQRILTLIRSLMRMCGCRIRLPSKIDDVDDLIDMIAEGNDMICERLGIILDALSRNADTEQVSIAHQEIGAEYIGTTSTAASGADQANRRYSALLQRFNRDTNSTSAALITSSSAKVAIKPQISYSISVDNSDSEFVPKLKFKHNTLDERASNLQIRDDDSQNLIGDKWSSNTDQQANKHPYQREIEHFQISASQLQLGSIREVKALKDTELIRIDCVEELEKLRDELNKVSEFAVDLEHHSYRTYQGLTCLMQISTAQVDYIVDPFPVWDHMHILNEPFTNPLILKVFHGSERDLLWLQRDFGIYVVGLFDTFFAMHILNFSKYSLAYLVHSVCNVTLDKALQKCDWRVRPLSWAHLEYARSDTHYLLHCYDVLRQRLINEGNATSNLIRAAYNESALLCRIVYEKPKFDAGGYEVLLRGRKSLNSRQLYALKALWKWRDDRARSEDESLDYVLPDHMLLQIAEVLPREAQGILACCSPIPPLVKQELITLHRIVYAARDRPLELRPIMNLNQATLNFDAYEELRSKMTKQKAMLRSHMDFSLTKFDEEISTTMADGNETEETNGLVTMKGSAELSLCDFATPGSMLTCRLRSDPVKDGKHSEQHSTDIVHQLGDEVEYSEQKREQVNETLSQWATPFECYTITVKERQLREEKKRKKAEEEEQSKRLDQAVTADENGEKKLWSHLDPASARPVFLEKKEQMSAEEMQKKRHEEAEAASTGLTEDMILTKKALKRKRKYEQGRPDIPRAGTQTGNEISNDDGSTPEKRRWTDANELSSAPVDYTKFDAQMFSEKPQRTGAYDAFSSSQRRRQQQRGRGRGSGSRAKKFDKNNGRSMSRGPQHSSGGMGRSK